MIHIFKHGLKNEWGHTKAIWKALMWNFLKPHHKEPNNHSSTFIGNIKIDLIPTP